MSEMVRLLNTLRPDAKEPLRRIGISYAHNRTLEYTSWERRPLVYFEMWKIHIEASEAFSDAIVEIEVKE